MQPFKALRYLLVSAASEEHRIHRERVHVVAVSCSGMCDMEKIKAQAKAPYSVREEGEELVVGTLYGEKRLSRRDVLLERCRTCKTKKTACYDELLGEDGQDGDDSRFDGVRRLEAMTPEERFCLLAGRAVPLHSMQRLPECLSGLLLREMRL